MIRLTLHSNNDDLGFNGKSVQLSILCVMSQYEER